MAEISTAPAASRFVLPTGLLLPADGQIPTGRARRTDANGPPPRWEIPYVSRFVNLSGERERTAWVHFCRGHHVEFIYWEATALACVEASSAVREERHEHAAHWSRRIDRLIRGSGAMLRYCGSFDPEVYDPCLRASMEAERDDFSGDMSADFLRMAEAKAEFVEACGAAGEEGDVFLAEFRAAERYWAERHGEVIMALHPGKSLLREKVEQLRAESENFDYRAYVAATVRGEQALADYDDYFGVERSNAMTIDDYWTQAVEKLAFVHMSFALEPRDREALMRGDAVLLAMVSERLEDADD